MSFVIAFGLTHDRRVVADLSKTFRSQLPAGIAVDTGRIDEEVSGDVGVQAFLDVGHDGGPHRRSGLIGETTAAGFSFQIDSSASTYSSTSFPSGSRR